MFVPVAEVGASQNNVACYARVSDIYKIVLFNMNPVDWSKVELNKAERITTNIGDFSMLHFSNAKWFNFVPCYSGVPTGVYEGKLDLLLRLGHTVDIEKFQSHLTDDTELIGAWSLEIGQSDFTKAVEKDIREFMSQKREQGTAVLPGATGDVGMRGNGANAFGPSELTNVFNGGVTTTEAERKVSRVFANVIHNGVWSVGKKLVNYEDDGKGYRKSLKDVFRTTHCPDNLLVAVEVDLLNVDKFSDVVAMASRAKEILSILMSAADVNSQASRDAVKLGLACSMAFSELMCNLHILHWNRDELEGLTQLAWVA